MTAHYAPRRGPALGGEQDLRKPDEKSQILLIIPLLSGHSVCCMSQVHGSMTLVYTRYYNYNICIDRTIYTSDVDTHFIVSSTSRS